MHRAQGLRIFTDNSINQFAATYMEYRGFNPILGFWAHHSDAFLNGLRADLIFTLILAALLAVLPRFVSILSFALLSAFYAANLEHIRYNMAHIELSLIGLGADPTFIWAQLTTALFSNIALYCALGLFLLYFGRSQFAKRTAIAFTALVIVCVSAPIYTVNLVQPNWVQTHPLLRLSSQKGIPVNDRSFISGALVRPRLQMLEETTTKKNLLIVYLEGLSELSLANGDMQNLQAIAGSNTHYTRYFGHQLVTINGLYSTLTGQLPKFSGALDDLIWFGMTANAPEVSSSLPNQLRRIGYQTHFIQSAELGYMSKGEMLPILGFDSVIGDESMEHWYSKKGWGVDDLALFERVITTIDSISDSQPWMIATLTSGTHAPYNVPDTFFPDIPSDRIRALKWADAAVAYLMQELDTRGLLDDTVIVFTSDESRERSGNGPLADEIALNWLPLIVVDADTPATASQDYIMTSDLPFLLLSQVTQTQRQNPINPDAPLIFGNIVSRRIFWYEPSSSELWACDSADFTCGYYQNVTDLGNLREARPISTGYFPGIEAEFSDAQ